MKFFQILTITFLFCFLSCGNDKTRELRPKAYELYQNKEYKLAIPIFEEILKLDPNNIEYRLRYGNSLEEIGQVEEGIKQYQIILETKKNHIITLVSLANAYRKIDEIDLALKTMQRVMTLKAKEPWILDNYGNILEAAGEYDLALKQYSLAVEYEPNDPEYRTDLANLCHKMGKDLCYTKGKNIRTIEIYQDLRNEAEDQYKLLYDQEKQAETEEARQKFNIQKEVYYKKYIFANDMVKKISSGKVEK